MRKRQHYLQSINEDSARTVAVRKVDRSTGAIEAPTTLSYRIDCRTTGVELVAWTAVTPFATTEIAIPATVNAIQNDRNDTEIKVLTALSDEGLSTQDAEEYQWEVVNLYGAGT
jgi:hypothetical protein